jgi:hypothetical protein
MKLNKLIILPVSLIFLLISSFVLAAPDFEVDFSTITNYPLVKSKIGFARALSHEKLPDSLQFIKALSPGIFCSEIDFDDVEDRNFALEPYPIEENKGNIIVKNPSPWLLDMERSLYANNIKILHQLIGAPRPYQQAVIKRPAIHPTPTDIKKSSIAMKLWATPYLERYPINWSIWNEPTHTLAGNNLRKAANDLIDIYQAYFNEIDPISEYDTFGMASFIAKAAEPAEQFQGRSFLNEVFREYSERKKNDPNLRLDYITFNSYFGKRSSLLSEARNSIGTGMNNVPLIMTQFAPYTEDNDKPGSSKHAVYYIDELDNLLRELDVEHVCFSYWVGGRKAFVNWNNKTGEYVLTPHYHALYLYALMPVWRVKDNGNLPFGVNAMASVDENSVAVMFWNKSNTDRTIKLNLKNIPVSLLSGKMGITIYHIDKEHGSPFEGSKSPYSFSAKYTIEKEKSGLIDVDVKGPGIAMLKIEKQGAAAGPSYDSLTKARLVRTYSYADRIKKSAGTVLNGSYGYYDAARASAYVGVTKSDGKGICGARYHDLPDKLAAMVRLSKPDFLQQKGTMLGIRIDYILKNKPEKSILWRFGQADVAKESMEFPWGKRGIDNLFLLSNDLIDDKKIILDIAGHAPEKWLAGKRDAIISFWVEGMPGEAHSRFRLTDKGI